MGLIPKQPKPESHATPATKLHKKFQRISTLEKCSKLADFTKLLSKAAYDEIDSVLTWLANQPPSSRSLSSALFVVKYDELAAQKRADLADYPVGEEAKTIAEEVASAGAQAIPARYVQHCIDEYRKFLEFLKSKQEQYPIAATLYDMLPPPSVFAHKWFSKLVPNYSVKFRKFAVMNPKFQQLLLKLGQGSARSVMQLVVEYDEKNRGLVNRRPELKR